jgi:hypothetical protein
MIKMCCEMETHGRHFSIIFFKRGRFPETASFLVWLKYEACLWGPLNVTNLHPMTWEANSCYKDCIPLTKNYKMKMSHIKLIWSFKFKCFKCQLFALTHPTSCILTLMQVLFYFVYLFSLQLKLK